MTLLLETVIFKPDGQTHITEAVKNSETEETAGKGKDPKIQPETGRQRGQTQSPKPVHEGQNPGKMSRNISTVTECGAPSPATPGTCVPDLDHPTFAPIFKHTFQSIIRAILLSFALLGSTDSGCCHLWLRGGFLLDSLKSPAISKVSTLQVPHHHHLLVRSCSQLQNISIAHLQTCGICMKLGLMHTNYAESRLQTLGGEVDLAIFHCHI